ncbi:nitroreductase family protein, partial [Acinetobacter sp. A11]
MSFFAKLFGLNQKATVSKDVVTQATQESPLFNQPSFLELIKKRRSIYSIGKNLKHIPSEIEELIQEAVKHSPSAFNSQSSRVVILFNESHQNFWNIVLDVLKTIVPAEALAGTEQKIQSFAA